MTKDEAIRKLWEAATGHWFEIDDETGQPRPLAELLYDSSTALIGLSIKGNELHEIGVALSFIEGDDDGGER